jgi:hypothetical protein
MKISTKITLTVLVGAMFLYVSCKKNATVSTPDKAATNNAEVSKQIALSLYHSLSVGVGSSNNGLKTNKTHGGLTTMDNTNKCGEVAVTPTNKTVVSGDTTRKYVGNSIFTYMCNGYFHNNWNIDAYTLSDTLKTTETGTGFANNYYVTLNYVVKSQDAGYSYVTVGGTTTASSHTSKLNGGTVTEYHDWATQYKLNDIVTKRLSDGSAVFVLGGADFTTTSVDKNATTAVNGNYSGTIVFLPNNTVQVFLNGSNGHGYIINLLTGEATPF